MLDAIAGPEPTSPYWAPPPARPFAAEVGAPPGTPAHRARPSARSSPPSRRHADCAAAADDAARLLADLGHDVEEADLDIDGDAFARDFFVLVVRRDRRAPRARGGAPAAAAPGAARSRPTPRSSPRSAASRPAVRAARARERLEAAVRAHDCAITEKFDLVLSPTLGLPPRRHRRAGARAAPRRSRTTCWSRCTSASCCACRASSRRRSGRCSRSSRSRRWRTSAASRR